MMLILVNYGPIYSEKHKKPVDDVMLGLHLMVPDLPFIQRFCSPVANFHLNEE